MRRQLENLRVTFNKQETQLKTLSDATWKAMSLLTDMAMAAKLSGKTRPMANAFMNFYDEKFKPVLQNIPTQRDRLTQTARVQDGGIQDLGSYGELGLANALRPTAVKTDERHLDRDIIDLTSNKNGERTGVFTHESDPGVVQKGGNVVLPSQESMDNGPSLFDYGLDNLYNDLIDDFDPYLEYGERYQNRTAFEDAFYG